MTKRKDMVIVALVTFCLAASWFMIGSTSSHPEIRMFNPWADLNNDGKIDIYDAILLAGAFGTSGQNYTNSRAGVLYDSGWVNITDKAGQSIVFPSGLGALDWNDGNITVEITGKTVPDGELLRHLGLQQLKGWNNHYGYNAYLYDEVAHAVVQTSDGGYALAGGEYLRGLGVSLVKTDANGVMQWNKSYSGVAQALVQTADGGFALAGYGVLGYNFSLVKTDANGVMQWNKAYVGVAQDLVQTADGGYALAGYTTSYGAGDYDFWLARTDSLGNMLWNRTYGGTGDDLANALVQTADGGYALAGYTTSYGAGDYDFWLVKTDTSGNMLWNRTYGGTDQDWANDMVQTADGGFALTGITESYGGYMHAWLVKTDANGVMQWNKAYGKTGYYQGAYSLVQTTDGGYALAGFARGLGYGADDFWLVKTDFEGTMQWNKLWGGAEDDVALDVVQTSDGGYALAGFTQSFTANIDADFWLVKINADGQSLNGEHGLIWIDSVGDKIILYRGKEDVSWNYVRVQILKSV